LNHVPSPPASVNKTMADLTEVDGRKMGKTMCSMLISNETPAAAVAEWLGKFPALTELSDQEPFFRPFIEVLTALHLSAADWGVKLRVRSRELKRERVGARERSERQKEGRRARAKRARAKRARASERSGRARASEASAKREGRLLLSRRPRGGVRGTPPDNAFACARPHMCSAARVLGRTCALGCTWPRPLTLPSLPPSRSSSVPSLARAT
jgi:hypothetical protein